jgi:hypothetical protein
MRLPVALPMLPVLTDHLRQWNDLTAEGLQEIATCWEILVQFIDRRTTSLIGNGNYAVEGGLQIIDIVAVVRDAYSEGIKGSLN